MNFACLLKYNKLFILIAQLFFFKAYDSIEQENVFFSSMKVLTTACNVSRMTACATL